jgi:hypothetical protein
MSKLNVDAVIKMSEKGIHLIDTIHLPLLLIHKEESRAERLKPFFNHLKSKINIKNMVQLYPEHQETLNEIHKNALIGDFTNDVIKDLLKENENSVYLVGLNLHEYDEFTFDESGEFLSATRNTNEKTEVWLFIRSLKILSAKANKLANDKFNDNMKKAREKFLLQNIE